MAIFTWLEGWYNPHRRHSALGYLSRASFALRETLRCPCRSLDSRPRTTKLAILQSRIARLPE